MDQAAEFLEAIRSGRADESHIVAELGEVIAGNASGRSSPDAVTVYKSVGVASQDIVTEQRIYLRALDTNLGTKVTL